MKNFCAYANWGLYITDFMIPNIIFCQCLHYSSSSSTSSFLYQRKISLPPAFLSWGNTNPKCFIQSKGILVRRKIVPPFTRHRFLLCCQSTQIACLTYNFPNNPNCLFFQKYATSGQTHKICPKLSSCQKLFPQALLISCMQLTHFYNNL